MSYSTPALLRKRIGPRLLLQILIPAGIAPADYDTTLQDVLTDAMKEIDVRIGHRTNTLAIALLANLEEQIALWFLWGTLRGFGEGETQAAGSKPGYDNAIALLDSGEIEKYLPAEPPPVTVGGTIDSADWSSAVPVYTKDNLRSF